MRILVNLIPEARLLKLKQRRNKKILTTIVIVTGIIVGTVIGTFIFLIGVNVALYKSQESQIATLKQDIKKSEAMEKEAATIQEHLESFKDLHNKRLLVSEIFYQFSNTIQPNVTIKSFGVSEDYAVTVSGTTDSLRAVGTQAKAIEDYNVNYKPKSFANAEQLFSEVKINSVGKQQESGPNTVTFTINFQADPEIFASASKVLGEKK